MQDRFLNDKSHPSNFIGLSFSNARFFNTLSAATHATLSLQWRHNGRDSVSNHQPHECLLRLSRRRWNKTSKLRVIGLCAGNSPGTGQIPAQMASNAEIVSIGWGHHVIGRMIDGMYHAYQLMTRHLLNTIVSYRFVIGQMRRNTLYVIWLVFTNHRLFHPSSTCEFSNNITLK